MKRILSLAALLAISALSAHADGDVQKLITQNDRKRLDAYETTRREALEESRKSNPADVAILDKVAAQPAISFKGFNPVGTWQCRTIKAGGYGNLVIYDWFKCRVSDDGAGWKFQKITGSQRTTGRFYDDGDKRMIYLGSGSVNEDKPLPYGSGVKSDQVAYAFRTGKKTWRLEFPAPYYESKLDIIELRK